MPEGPSLKILSEELRQFAGKKVVSASGYAAIDFNRLSNQKILAIKSHGKHLLIVFKDFYIRIHLLMFGTYRINERRDFDARLSLKLKDSEINFYTCSVKLSEGDPDAHYDWETDLMSPLWNPRKATTGIKALGQVKACDLLLNQQIFAGSGNIIKNEVLFLAKIHPLSNVRNLPAKKLRELVRQAAAYSHNFYKWKLKSELKKHWQIYKKQTCPRCQVAAKKGYLGATKRLTCYCTRCQVKY